MDRPTPCAAGSLRMLRALLVPTLICCLRLPVRAETIVLKNGMQLQGSVGQIASLKAPVPGAFGAGAGTGSGIKSVVVVDDGLRRTFVPSLQVTAVPDAVKSREVKIRIDQQVAETGYQVNTIGPILQVKPWDEYGRRTFSMGGPKGRLDVVQGITEVTPLYCRVQGLRASTSYVWDMRIATSSIPRETLSRILKRIDPKSSAHRLQIVALYIEADRIQDARVELEEVVVEEFPDLVALKDQIDTLRQIGAQRLIREVKIRGEAGQHRMAYAMAVEFPVMGVADATVLSLRDIVKDYEEQKKQYDAALSHLKSQLEAVEDEAIREKLKPYCEEIIRDLNVNTMDRLADFIRLVDDKSLTSDQKVALALTGWILGSGSGTENTAVAVSIGRVRDLVRDYLATKRRPDRAALLEQLAGLEGNSPAHLAKIVAHMKPPLDPPQIDEDALAGLHEIKIPGMGDDAEFTYLVQLPPEYDPYRKYPCVVTLHSAGSTAEQQIDWWAGPFAEKSGGRLGQATRHGYIVIAPKWTKEHQQVYEHSTREHAAVLFSLRDAMQKFSIDSDRVFLSGHSLGGDAVWDIAVSHPDLWAGVIPITPSCEKFVTLYHENARHVPWFFVVGEKDGKRQGTTSDGKKVNENLLTQFDYYLERSGYDVMISEFLGRGHEHFYDEIQRLFEWMRLHRRNFFPKEFNVVTVRESDNFFWFLEVKEMPPKVIVNPLAWPSRGINTLKVDGKILDTNGVTVKPGGKGGSLFLSPEMLDFDRKMLISIGGKNAKPPDPRAEVLLEDVRTRSDRQHPFWARIDF